MPNVLQRLWGELSALRTSGVRWGNWYAQPYTLDSTRVDVKLARELYNNTHESYKLGAAFARPVINTAAGFVGTPQFDYAHDKLGPDLAAWGQRWSGLFGRLTRNVFRDGDAYVRMDSDGRLRLVPPEWVTPVLDPVTGDWREVRIRYPIIVPSENGGLAQELSMREIITPTSLRIEVDPRAPAELREKAGDGPNPWGLIPMVHFRNEAEENQLYGASELEPLEPFMKAYHDTMLSTVRGSQLFSRPKVQFALRDVNKFLKDNFPGEAETGKLSFTSRDLFLMQEGDNVSFITAESGVAASTLLLEFLFMNIVDVSETPEFAFGTAVSSSKASVSEQMVPLARKIRRKRTMLEEPYRELAVLYLAMKGQPLAQQTDDVRISWDEISPRDNESVATTIKTLVEGLSTAVEVGILSLDAASGFLQEFVPTMLPFEDPSGANDEKRRIAKSHLWRRRIEDVEGWVDDQEGAE